MTPAIVEVIAEQLHKEYRATQNHMAGHSNHNHGWKGCHSKAYFRKRAAHMAELFRYVTLSDPDVTAALAQLQQARELLATAIRAYGDLDRQHRATIAKLRGQNVQQQKCLEAATAAGITFDGVPETGEITARNKLAEKRPTRIIKIAYTAPLGRRADAAPAVETVPDATGDSGQEYLQWTDKTRSQVAAESDVLL